jgi:hypothetical protein
MPAGWDHDKVILGLVKRGETICNLEMVDIWVQLWKQKPNCALIYTTSSPWIHGKGWELYIRESAKSFDKSKIDLNADYLEKVGTTKDWDKYKVKDWNKLAEKLNLSFGETTSDE